MKKWENNGNFSINYETRQRYLLSPLLFKIVLKTLTKAIMKEKEITGIQIRNGELKSSLFTDDMILYI